MATNYEFGIKGRFAGSTTRYELAAFHIKVEDEITPFELAEFPGRLFYRNASQSTHDGIEAPFVGVNNLFDESYNANMRINAFGGRYFEPAPDGNFYGGLTVRKRFGS